MLNIFSYGFMIKAFAVAVLIGVISPCIGISLVLKRLSAIGDATSHSALAGVAAGLMMGVNPVIGAIVFSALAVLCIEIMRRSFKSYSEIAAAIVMSAGIGLTAILSDFVPGSFSLESFMFGSIVAISDFEMYLTAILAAVVICVCFFLYKELFFIAFDEEAALIAGVPVNAVNIVLMLLTAVTVSVSARVVGALMISSLLVIPTACAMTIGKSYKKTLLISILFAELFTVSGLFASFYLNLRPGGTIVLIGVAVLIICVSLKRSR